jgi:hypothetical protein
MVTKGKKATRKGSKDQRIQFKKADFERFAEKMGSWSESLSPKERALLIAVLDKGSRGIRAGADQTVQTTTTVSRDAEGFDLGQFIVKLLLAIQGVYAEVDAEGDNAWINEITATTR